MAARAIWPPVQYGHPCNMAECRTPSSGDPSPAILVQRSSSSLFPSPHPLLRASIPQPPCSPLGLYSVAVPVPAILASTKTVRQQAHTRGRTGERRAGGWTDGFAGGCTRRQAYRQACMGRHAHARMHADMQTRCTQIASSHTQPSIEHTHVNLHNTHLTDGKPHTCASPFTTRACVCVW